MTSSTSSTYNVSSSSSGAASISGLASGIDTASLVNSLMTLESQPQTDLKTKLSATQAQTTALQAINAKLASLATTAAALAKSTTFRAASATSSNAAITTSVTGTPATGTLQVSVSTLATAQSAEFAGAGTTGNSGTGWTAPATVATFPITLVANGVSTTLHATSYSAADVAAALNASGAGVSAAVITDASAQKHLILTANTGNYSAATTPGFSLTLGGAPSSQSADLTPAADASITVAGITKTSHTNTFTDVTAGLNLMVNALVSSGSPATVTTTQNTSSIVTAASGVVASIQSVLSDISFHSTAPAAGLTASSTNGGLLAGDSTVRTIGQALANAVSGALSGSFTAGQTAADAGITTGKDGTVSVDTTVLTSFLAANPTIAQTVLTAFGTSVAGVAKAASDPLTGNLTASIATAKSAATDYTTRISAWDLRLAQRKATLTAQYTAMETALSKLQSQSSALTQALKSLDTSNND